MSDIEIIPSGCGRRRYWSASEKLRIVEETLSGWTCPLERIRYRRQYIIQIKCCASRQNPRPLQSGHGFVNSGSIWKIASLLIWSEGA